MWWQWRLQLLAERAETIEETLLEWGALSVTYQDAADDPILEPALGTHPLWKRSVLLVLFDHDADMEWLRAQAREFLQAEEWESLHCERLQDQQWERAWMDHYQAMCFGGEPPLWIVPSHLPAPEPQACNLRLDPGLAFGTGTHATTAMCLRWMAENRMPPTVLDYGCGSGVLGVAAALLGAAQVQAVDIDAQAVQATLDNARANNVTIEASLPGEASLHAAQLVLANILLEPLLLLREPLSRLTQAGGVLLMTGVLARQVPALVQAYAPDFTLEVAAEDDGWALVLGIRTA